MNIIDTRTESYKLDGRIHNVWKKFPYMIYTGPRQAIHELDWERWKE